MKYKWLLLSGAFACIVYVGTVILGGLLRPGYSHLAEPISELTAAGAPNQRLLDVPFFVYNLLMMAFGMGLFRTANGDPRGNLRGRLAGLALVATGICGALLQLFFHQDPGGVHATVVTTIGTLHIVFAGIAALTSMLAILLSGLWFRQQIELKGYVAYSYLTLLVMFISGGFGAAAATSSFALFGLAERITIGAFILWLFLVSLRLYTTIPGRRTLLEDSGIFILRNRSAGD